ncbi:MAG: methyltransferase domain-containing protein, partial [Alkalispirochaeta sp.]
LEVIEHLHQPRAELERLLSLLLGGGRLILRTGVFDARDPAEDIPAERGSTTPATGISTTAASPAASSTVDASAADAHPAGNGPAAERFLAWWYRRDPTHVVFLTPRTIAWLQEHFGLRLIHRAKGEELVFAREG